MIFCLVDSQSITMGKDLIFLQTHNKSNKSSSIKWIFSDWQQLYPEVVQAFQPILGCLVLHACDNLHMRRVKGLLRVLVYHTLSCHQDATLAEQSPAAGQVPECGLL